MGSLFAGGAGDRGGFVGKGDAEGGNAASRDVEGKGKGAVGVGPNLESAIERLVERQRGDRVDCTRVFGDYYRVNWWSPVVAVQKDGVADNPGLLAWATWTTHRVRDSRFLHAVREEGLVRVSEIVGSNRGREVVSG